MRAILRWPLFVFVVGVMPTPSLPAQPKPDARLGINLAGPADWSTELLFCDVFRLSRHWISQRQGEGWGKGPPLELDAHGWVKRLEPNCWAETPICTIEGGRYPSGNYTVAYRGRGKLEFWGAASVTSQEPGKIALKVDAKKGGFFLRLKETDPTDPVRDIRVMLPDTSEADGAWNPVFLRLWAGMACVRFMDLMHTNNSTIKTWAERPKPSDATFTGKGLPIELLVDLANRLDADPWFCMPHLADDDFIRKFARLVKQQLGVKRKVYVEYSNEVWNGQFKQNQHAAAEGKRLGFAEKPWEAAWRFTAHRSVEIFRIWEEEFGGRERLIRVLPSQAANAYVSSQIVSFKDAYKNADALAIAPYLSMNVVPKGKINVDTVQAWKVDQVLDFLEKTAMAESTRWIRDNKKVADKHELKLIAYEGGQHMVGVAGGENSIALTKLFHAANAHPRIEGIYRRHLDIWTEEGGDLFCHFSSVGGWSKWGSWGLLQSLEEDPSASPKFRAVMGWAKARGQKVPLTSIVK